MCYIIDAIMFMQATCGKMWQKDKYLGAFLEQKFKGVHGTPLLLRLLEFFSTGQSSSAFNYLQDANESTQVSIALVNNIQRCIDEGKRDQMLPIMEHLKFAVDHVEIGFLFGKLELVVEHFSDPAILMLVFETLYKSMRYCFMHGTLSGCSTLIRKILHVIPEEKKLMACQIIKCDRVNAYYDTAVKENLLHICAKD